MVVDTIIRNQVGVDMLTRPVAAARAAVARERRVKLTHMYLIRGSVGAEALLLPSSGGFLKKGKKGRILPPLSSLFS